MKKRLFTIALLTASVFSLNISCSDDFVERKFYQNVEQSPLTNLQEMHAFVRGAYASMRSATYYGSDFLAYGEIRSDKMYSNTNSGYYLNVQNYTMLSTDAYATDTWNQIYAMIAKTNLAINSDINAFTGTDLDKSKSRFLQGEAYALRAQGFFDLLRLYGQKYTGGNLGVVLPLEYEPKAQMPRATIAETEAQIEADFNKALELMNANTSPVAAAEKTELSVNALKVLMSRYYLYKGDYAKVRQLTADVIGQYQVIDSGLLAVSFSDIMNGAAPNSVFELAVGQPAALGTSSYAYRLNPNGYSNLQLKTGVFAALYETNDVRRSLITTKTAAPAGQYITAKYNNLTGINNIKVIRYEEVLLNAIEAELNGGSAAKALEYYNQIITKRGLTAKTSVTMADLKEERARELLGEGFRQWDLLRWGDISFKPANKSDNLLAFPIPRAEINISGTKIVQNPGYEN